MINKAKDNGKIMLYYNTIENVYLILNVRPGDILSKKTNFTNEYLKITKEMIKKPVVSFDIGIVPINISTLFKLKKYNSIDIKKLFLLFKNRKNTGFILR